MSISRTLPEEPKSTVTVARLPEPAVSITVPSPSAGQEIAGIGNEGRSTGPHLHFEIHPGGGAPVDPVSWFNERGISV